MALVLATERECRDEAKKDVIIVGDFNFPEIDWDLHHSINNSYGSTFF